MKGPESWTALGSVTAGVLKDIARGRVLKFERRPKPKVRAAGTRRSIPPRRRAA